MTTEKRLTRLEQWVNEHRRRTEPKDNSVADELAELKAYCLGKGPRPPRRPEPECPKWTDSVWWESERRVFRLLDAWSLGERPVGDYPPEMTDEQCRRADKFHQAFKGAAARMMMPPVKDYLDEEV